MHNRSFHLPCSLTALASGTVAVLALVYIGLIAVVMSYAALTVEFTQSVRNDGAEVAALEGNYFAASALIADTDYAAAGYTKPIAERFVPAASVTALR